LQEALNTFATLAHAGQLPAGEHRHVLALIECYAQAAMPFTPLEYPRSSVKRLVEDLRALILA
jgi:hypothetical protein